VKVRELQDKLSKLNQELEVLGYTEDEALLAKGHGFRLLEIHAVSESEGEMIRTEDHLPSVKLGKSPASTTFVILEVTAVF
jgi:hypothetical protein